MIVGTLFLVVLTLIGGRVGYLAADWWVEREMPNAGMEELLPMAAGIVFGALAGLATGLAVAYVLGKRQG